MLQFVYYRQGYLFAQLNIENGQRRRFGDAALCMVV